MVVVVITAAGAILILRAYNSLPGIVEPQTVIERVQQATAVLASLCAATFAIITALRTFKPPSFGGTGSLPISHTPGTFGRPAGQLSGATS